jgi:antagonist of KipI
MPFIRIHAPGLLTTVQDLGRWGYQAHGVPVAGPMDWRSHGRANELVGNAGDAATLEVTLTGPEIEFESATAFAVAGAEFALSLDGAAAQTSTLLTAHAGSRLIFGERRIGARAYVAIAGGILTPAFLGSRATHIVSRLGGLEGRALRRGDCLEVSSGGRRVRARSMNVPGPLPAGGARLRVVLGPHDDRFSSEAFAELEVARYRLTAESDRMGYRLEGTPLNRTRSEEMPSSAMPLGGLQVPASGQPILLMADHATTGGYPVIATVVTADLPLAGQLAPSDWVEFSICSLADARRALLAVS